MWYLAISISINQRTISAIIDPPSQKDLTMLALMRRKNESIFIYPGNISEGMTVAELFAGGPIEIIVSDTNDAQCKLGISAPIELNIVRDELMAD